MRVFIAGVGNWSWLLIPHELGITVEPLYSEGMVWGQILLFLYYWWCWLNSTPLCLFSPTLLSSFPQHLWWVKIRVKAFYGSINQDWSFRHPSWLVCKWRKDWWDTPILLEVDWGPCIYTIGNAFKCFLALVTIVLWTILTYLLVV